MSKERGAFGNKAECDGGDENMRSFFRHWKILTSETEMRYASAQAGLG